MLTVCSLYAAAGCNTRLFAADMVLLSIVAAAALVASFFTALSVLSLFLFRRSFADGLSEVAAFEGNERLKNINTASTGIALMASNVVSNIAAAVSCFILLSYAVCALSPFAELLLLFLAVAMLLLVCNFLLPFFYLKRSGVKGTLLKMTPFMEFVERGASRIYAPFVRLGDAVDGASTQEEGSADSDEKRMLEGVISFCDKTVQEVMTARVDIVGVDASMDFASVLDTVETSGYSRLPVYDGTLDNVKGIVYIKDLLPHTDAGDGFDWHSLMRSAYFVPETKMIGDLLEEFRKCKVHLAVVVDEFGETSGIVSLEDLLEEIVGEISDEYDDEPLPYEKLGDGTFVFEGKTPLGDFFRATGLDDSLFSDYDEADSVAGLILSINEDFPKEGDVIGLNGCRFTVLEMDNRRIVRVKVELTNDRQEKNDE